MSDSATAVPLWSTIFGPVVQDSHQREHDTDVILGGIQLVGIYFATRRISRSPRFMPHLKFFYNNINKDSKKFEVVVVSLDKKNEDYLLSFPEKSQWYALPFGSQFIKTLDIRYEPPGGFALTVIQPNGEVIRTEGDSDILRDKSGKRTFQKWLSAATMEAPPAKEAPESASASAEAEATEPAPAQEPLPTNVDGQTVAWTELGAEKILPWPMGRYKSMPFSEGMLTAEQLKFIAEQKNLLPGEASIEDVIAELQVRKWVEPKAIVEDDPQEAKAA